MEKATYSYRMKDNEEDSKRLIEENGGSRDFGMWARPSIQGIANIIEKIPEDYDEVLRRGKLCAEWIRKNETYEICANRLLEEML